MNDKLFALCNILHSDFKGITVNLSGLSGYERVKAARGLYVDLQASGTK